LDDALLSRIEDASINASAPLQQRWLDGWLVRYSPGKARRARCIHAVAEGRSTLAERLRSAQAVFDAAGLPMVFRITPYTRPDDLDAALEHRGFDRMDETLVLARPLPTGYTAITPMPVGTHAAALNAEDASRVLAQLRRSPPEQEQGHLRRLQTSPVPYLAWAIRRDEDDLVLACGQMAQENEMVGLYDVHTHDQHRNRGLAKALCDLLLARAASAGARVAYLQVEATNQPARRVYDGLGFQHGYTYHYRQRPSGALPSA
jgi:ribosomal protein S18 acetylase RimI-like enzyme